jgi:ATP-dependent helicase/nuclease subunit A
MTVATRAAGLSDADGRRLIHDALDETLVVEAAAGTGKTTELVTRIVRMISEGRAAVREIVAVTFTEKAAGELKLRLRQRLEESRRQAGSPEVARRLDEAVQNLEEAHVSTIHGFCADLLRERPVEARVDPLFRVLTEGQASRIFNAAFDAWFQICLDAPSEGVRRSLRRPSRAFRPGDVDEDGPMERLRRAGFELTQWRDFRAPWTREPFDRRVWIERIVRLVRVLAQASDGASYAGDNLSIDTEPVRRLARQLAGIDVAALDERDLDGLEAQLVELQRNRDFKKARKGSGPTYAKGMPRAQVLAARDALVEGLNEFQLRADADLAALLHAELQDAVAVYETLKARSTSWICCSRRAIWCATMPSCARTFNDGSRACSWTSSRTPIRCRRSCFCCLPRATPPRPPGQRSRPCPGSCSSSATRSSRFIAFDEPTCRPIGACAICW